VVFVGPLQLGAIDEQQLRAARAPVGVRFVRTPVAASPAPVAGATATTIDAQHRLLARSSLLAFQGDTLVSRPGELTPLPGESIAPAPHGWKSALLGVEILGPDAARPALRAALVAAMTVGVPISVSEATRPVIVVDDSDDGNVSGLLPAVKGIAVPWMADVIEAVTRDAELGREVRGLKATSAAAVTEPWRVVLRDADNGVLIAAAAASQSPAALVFRVRAPAHSPALAAVLRSALIAGTDPRALSRADTLPIPDARLAAWTRPAGEIDERSVGAPKESDRRWFWAAVLAALGAETWLRRRKTPMPALERGGHERAA
jgi:hypothetical protein